LGILSDFERRLEGLIEGAFTKAFRTGVQPRELATRIMREMDTNKTVGVREVWVPNRFVIRLSPGDHERFQQTEKVLRGELEQVVRDHARERQWGLVGPPEVLFETDQSLKQGVFECEAALVEGPTGSHEAADPGAKAGAATADAKLAKLVMLEKGRPAKVFDLGKDRVIIGRLPESDVPVSDPGVSRRHAELRREDGGYILVDLGSTNGTKVNEAPIGERVLEEGDRITIGRTVLEFRRR
jgi:FhaA, N-terminal domain/FHA domain